MVKRAILFSLNLILLVIIFPLSTNAATYNVVKYGAKPNGRTDSTKSFLRAWSLALVFNGPCRSKRVTVQIDGTIQAPPRNYWVIGNSRNWILFHGINGLTINGGKGGGILNARGYHFWDCRRSGRSCPQGATTLSLDNVKNGFVNGIVSVDSQWSHMSINGCTNMRVRRVVLIAPAQSPNTDGIDIQSSTGVTIVDSSIGTGDDCIAIGPGTKKLLIQGVNCGPGHGISIGSLARSPNEAGVEEIVVKDVTFTGSGNGLRIKTWPRPSNGFVKNVLYQNIRMNYVRNPIIIDQIYCPGTKGCSNKNSGIKISGVAYLNVYGTSATPIAVNLHCSATNPCNGIKLYNVDLTYSKKPASAFCFCAAGTSQGRIILTKMDRLFIILYSLTLIILLFLITFLPSTNAGTYNVAAFGAKTDGTDSTKPFLQAWSLACSSEKPATMWIPRGTYLLKKTAFSGPCRSKRVTVQVDGRIQAPTDFWFIGNSGSWILFQGIDGLTINGGILDARGSHLWNCRRYGANCPQGATSLSLSSVKNGIVNGLISVDSQRAHMSVNGCNNLRVRRVTLIAPDQSPNTDGIDIQSSTAVTIVDSSIRTGDDCIAIGPGTKNLMVQRVGCGPGHGISIGSLARNPNEAGVEGITVKDVTFTGSDNGLRIKTWPKPSNSFVKNVLYQNIVMNNVRNPIIIDQIYCPGTKGCSKQNSGVKISGVTYQNIRGTSATPIAVRFHCSATTPCSGIKLSNVKLTYSKQPAKSFCSSATGTSQGQVAPQSCNFRIGV
ncbi:hypothetical protein C5167_030250 [Papaver somniferum]|nr:hypothetical protein C5167_030250 [Papaver somniferum]